MTPVAADDREEGRERVERLCAEFAENLDYYKSVEFDETTARQRFIDPFFAALGWDVADEDRQGPFADVLLEFVLRRAAVDPNQLSLDHEEAEDRRVEAALAASAEIDFVG